MLAGTVGADERESFLHDGPQREESRFLQVHFAAERENPCDETARAVRGGDDARQILRQRVFAWQLGQGQLREQQNRVMMLLNSCATPPASVPMVTNPLAVTQAPLKLDALVLGDFALADLELQAVVSSPPAPGASSPDGH